MTAYHQTADFSKRTQELYQAKIAKELFLARYERLGKKEGTWRFDSGKITYTTKDETVTMDVELHDKHYSFEETFHKKKPAEPPK